MKIQHTVVLPANLSLNSYCDNKKMLYLNPTVISTRTYAKNVKGAPTDKKTKKAVERIIDDLV